MSLSLSLAKNVVVFLEVVFLKSVSEFLDSIRIMERQYRRWFSIGLNNLTFLDVTAPRVKKRFSNFEFHCTMFRTYANRGEKSERNTLSRSAGHKKKWASTLLSTLGTLQEPLQTQHEQIFSWFLLLALRLLSF